MLFSYYRIKLLSLAERLWLDYVYVVIWYPYWGARPLITLRLICNISIRVFQHFVLSALQKHMTRIYYETFVTFEKRRRTNAHSRSWTGPPLWSSGQCFWLQIQRSRVRSPALPDFLSSSGSGTGFPLPREVNWGATWMKKVAAPGLENRD